MMFYTTNEYKDAGCLWMDDDMECLVLFMDAYTRTAGRVCDIPCIYYRHGTCPAYSKLTSPLTARPQHSDLLPPIVPETIRQEAHAMSNEKDRRKSPQLDSSAQGLVVAAWLSIALLCAYTVIAYLFCYY